ncbi:MAG: DUF1947 domain-containing protein [Candidatus Hydrothermarchaeota archaeon]
MDIKKRHAIQKKDVKKLIYKVENSWKMPVTDLFKNAKMIEIAKTENYDVVIVDGFPVMFTDQECIFPTIKLLQSFDLPFKKVTVDMGAVKHIVSGANTMIPGIVELDEIERGEIVVIVEEKNKKPLAVGRALMNKEEIKRKKKGRAIETVHHIGDKIWRLKL